MEPQKGAVLPKEREQRQKERDDLRLLVGKNLARLGQLEGVDGEKYKEVSCLEGDTCDLEGSCLLFIFLAIF